MLQSSDWIQITGYTVIGIMSYILGRYHQAIMNPKCVACDLWDWEHSK